MWLLTPDGFFSAVAFHGDTAKLTVRARVLADAEYLAERVNALRYDSDERAEVIAYQSSDYPWRVIVQRTEWALFLMEQVDVIDYTNFKNRVTAKQGRARHDIYSKVWSALLALEQLPGAMKDHAKRAVPHPVYAAWRREPTLGELADPSDPRWGSQLPIEWDAIPDDDEGCEVCGSDDDAKMSWVPDPGDTEFADYLVLCRFHRTELHATLEVEEWR